MMPLIAASLILGGFIPFSKLGGQLMFQCSALCLVPCCVPRRRSPAFKNLEVRRRPNDAKFPHLPMDCDTTQWATTLVAHCVFSTYLHCSIDAH